MNNNITRIMKNIFKILAFLIGIYLIFKLTVWYIPFIVAFMLSTVIEPIVRFMEKKLKLPRKIGAAISLLFVLSVFGSMIGLIISRLIKEIVTINEHFSQISKNVEATITGLIDKANEIYLVLPIEITQQVDVFINDLTVSAKEFISQIVTFVTNFAISLPEAIIFIVIVILGTFFMTSDRDKINVFLKNQIPHHWLDKTQELINSMFSALLGWIRAQLIMMTITFTELIIGFLVMRVENMFLIAIIIAVVDALPILGAGSVLIPWGLISLISGDYRMGFSLLLLYTIVIVVRQLVEPRIIGAQMGIHPLLTLFGMYTGFQLIGVFGIIIGPMTIMVIKNMFTGILENESIKDWISRKLGRKKPTPSE